MVLFLRFIHKNFAYVEKKQYLCAAFWSAHVRNARIYVREKAIVETNERDKNMTALQLNADIYQNLAVLSEHESMLNKAAKYIRRLVKQVEEDPTCMTKEEYFAMLDRAEQGPTYRMLPGEDVTAFLKRQGYDI